MDNAITYLIILVLMVSFTYNMTEDLNSETRRLDVCMVLHLDNRACQSIYGDIGILDNINFSNPY